MLIRTEIRKRFGDLPPGATFISDSSEVFLKLENNWRKECKWNAVRLSDGYLDWWKDATLIVPIKLTVTEAKIDV